MTVEEYQVGQLWSVAEASKAETGGGEGVEAHGLPPEELSRREVVHIDIADDNEYLHAGDINPSTCPSTFVSSKTGRRIWKKNFSGPLTGGWMETVDPVMCAYKLVTVHFKWFGLQKMVESYTHTQYPRLFSKFHREVFCWIDNWYGLTMADIRAIEAKAQKELEEQRKSGQVGFSRNAGIRFSLLFTSINTGSTG
ncbi:phosphatidylinositol transfer protein [Teladorsagia circumcincta]|uniref:Phosphatidylinositol transfer protein n=1 Tax=Teladorsagia circumcincta TaxID=45464 RepID=A0A2G9UTZ8_TELCI|nr:phosphatidylinositol transfer protein [Teladorsagia circumcincta]